MKNNDCSFLIADDHEIIRKGVTLILNSISKKIEIFHSESLETTITKLKEEEINYLVLDISFKNEKSIDIVSLVKKINPSLKILIFSMHEEIEYVIRYLNEGADGYLSKVSTQSEIESALKIFIETGTYLNLNVKEQLINSTYFAKKENPLKQLSNREYEVSKLLIIGSGTSEISNILGLKNSTISTIKRRVFEKLDINSVVSLIQVFKLYE